MTAKRFIAIDDGFDFMVKDIVTDDNLIDADGVADVLNDYEKENEQLKQQVQKIHKLINSKIQSARELGSVRTVIALKNLQRELIGDLE